MSVTAEAAGFARLTRGIFRARTRVSDFGDTQPLT